MAAGKTLSLAAGVLVAVGMASARAEGAIVTFNASAGNRAASASFENASGVLKITLSNTSTFDVGAPADLLTGVFWDIAGSALTLTKQSVVLAPGSVVHFGPTDPGGVVGGEFGYAAALVGAPNGAKYGVSSAGLGLFGPSSVFPGSDLIGPVDPNGPDYGITSQGDNIGVGNPQVTGGRALIQYSVVISLGNLPMGFDPAASIGNVRFQYGTALNEGNIVGEPGVPTPGAAALLAAGAVVAMRRKRGINRA